MDINNIFIILTPFQKRMAEQIFSDELRSENSLIIKSEIVSNFENSYNVETLSMKLFSIFELLREPFKQFVKTRKIFKSIEGLINKFESKYDYTRGFNLIIGTDKDIFTQVFINRYFDECEDNHNKLIAIEEGVGYYLRESKLDLFKKFIYPKLSFFLFNHKINYVRVLGLDKRINEVFVRFPELIKNKQKNVVYKKILSSKSNNAIEATSRRDILFFSLPEQDYNKDITFKEKLYEYIINHYLDENDVLYIKPHPREKIKELLEYGQKNRRVKIIEKIKLGEEINVHKYKNIVNFSSSIIFYLVSVNYPMDKIITIGFKNKPSVSIFRKTKYMRYNKIIKSLN